MRRRFIQIDGELVEYDPKTCAPVTAMVMPDIQPYQSMADGSLISSRSQHRAHLKAHGCIEVGNEALNAKPQPIPDVNPAGRKESIRSQVANMRHDDFRRMLKSDLDRIRWQSRDR